VKARREGRRWSVCSKGKYAIIAGKGACKRKCGTCVVCTADGGLGLSRAAAEKDRGQQRERVRARARERDKERERDFSRCECSG